MGWSELSQEEAENFLVSLEQENQEVYNFLTIKFDYFQRIAARTLAKDESAELDPFFRAIAWNCKEAIKGKPFTLDLSGIPAYSKLCLKWFNNEFPASLKNLVIKIDLSNNRMGNELCLGDYTNLTEIDYSNNLYWWPQYWFSFSIVTQLPCVFNGCLELITFNENWVLSELWFRSELSRHLIKSHISCNSFRTSKKASVSFLENSREYELAEQNFLTIIRNKLLTYIPSFLNILFVSRPYLTDVTACIRITGQWFCDSQLILHLLSEFKQDKLLHNIYEEIKMESTLQPALNMKGASQFTPFER